MTSKFFPIFNKKAVFPDGDRKKILNLSPDAPRVLLKVQNISPFLRLNAKRRSLLSPAFRAKEMCDNHAFQARCRCDGFFPWMGAFFGETGSLSRRNHSVGISRFFGVVAGERKNHSRQKRGDERKSHSIN